jgi:hypothetical protein
LWGPSECRCLLYFGPVFISVVETKSWSDDESIDYKSRTVDCLKAHCAGISLIYPQECMSKKTTLQQRKFSLIYAPEKIDWIVSF